MFELGIVDTHEWRAGQTIVELACDCLLVVDEVSGEVVDRWRCQLHDDAELFGNLAAS